VSEALAAMTDEDAVKALAALAQPSRLQVFRLLVVAGRQGMTPGAIAEALSVPPATLSFHLKELANAGLASQQREGRYLIYRAAYERMNELLAYLTDHCCQGAECMAAQAVVCEDRTGRGKGERISIDTRFIRSGN